MPCKFQSTFDIRMEDPAPRQLSLGIQPRGVTLWSRAPKASGELIHDAFYDMQHNADIGDECDIVVPVVGGQGMRKWGNDIEAGAGLYAVPDLAHMEQDQLVPVCSNGVLQKFVKEIVDDKRSHAKAAGFDPRRLPQDEQQAKRMGMKEQHILPPWMTDKLILASIEKWIRENALEHVGDLRDLHEGEEQAGAAATRLFLETGWNPISDSATVPRSVRNSSELGEIYKKFRQAQELLSGADVRQLSHVGLLSDYLVNNGSEETCTYTAPWISAQGFDSVPEFGLSGEDMDDVHDIISRKLSGAGFDDVLTNPEHSYRYNYQPGHSKKILAVAEQVWQRMVQLDGAYVGMHKEEAPNRMPTTYLQQDRHINVVPPSGRYKVLDSGLAIPE